MKKLSLCPVPNGAILKDHDHDPVIEDALYIQQVSKFYFGNDSKMNVRLESMGRDKERSKEVWARVLNFTRSENERNDMRIVLQKNNWPRETFNLPLIHERRSLTISRT